MSDTSAEQADSLDDGLVNPVQLSWPTAKTARLQ
jgi:hypothetical protein